ncbi:hypothetical protein PR202_gb12343 [Eleusine coracana subsp. coracana]|uniref:Aldehyde oxidase n=1 Tax=Eleusine coracana subsp. coracana TaxID=191504 RepID=A0AAV5EQ96_ELECO|nr:hypothetical protein PR202_gb12343 [Eleusine coracana subsp. coracana]
MAASSSSSAAAAAAPEPTAVVFAVNGERVELRDGDVDPGATLLEFLRTRTRFTGPKLGCGEGTRHQFLLLLPLLGGCGACVVLLSTYDAATGAVTHAAASSCLTLVHGLHHRAVTTTEGLKSRGGGLHAVHERLAGFHASQCGFCTPGVCMSLAAALAGAEKDGTRPGPRDGFSRLTAAEAERAVAGNLCRCTGYRPIADACKSFAADVDLEDLGLNSFWRKGEASVSKLPRYNEGSIGAFPEFLKAEIRASLGIDRSTPAALVRNGSNWYRPRSVEEYYKLVGSELFSQSKIKVVVGNTASGVYREAELYDSYIDLKGIPELNSVKKDAKGIKIGAAVSISRAIEILREGDSCKDVVFSKIADHMEKVASGFVRNTASVGGNLIMAQRDQFASDIATILLAAGSSICIQIVVINKDYLPVGIPAKKVGAELQASGEAVFVDDIPSPKDCLYGAFIYSTKPLAHVKGIELDPSLKQLKNTTVVTVNDIREGGDNVGASTVFGLEPLFGDPLTQCAGEPLGVVIAETQRLANVAAKRAVISYSTENLDTPILSIEDAVRRCSYFETPPFLLPQKIGDFSKGMAEADQKIFSAEVQFLQRFADQHLLQVKLNSQYFFYMETQTALAIPDEDNCMVVYSSSQCPETAQTVIAKCLGLPCHNVRVITRRVGGGFGGKAVRSLPVATACALAAFKLHRPVRMYLDRKTDMIMTGGRHPMKICYSVGFKSDGKITALHVDLFINAGMTKDVSPAIPHNFIEMLKKYNWGAFSYDAKVCKTNIATRSAMRGPGEVQGSYVAEAIIEHVASALSTDANLIRRRNLHTVESLALFHSECAEDNAQMTGVDLSAREYYVPGPSGTYLNYGAAASEVEIDLLTGTTTVLRSDLIYDCGQSLNPAVDLGQVEGAFVQGIGYFMNEEYVTNPDGLLVSDGTWTYKIPTLDTIPKQFNIELLNSGFHKKRVLSSKASGEPPLVLAASVHCAIREAIRAARKEIHFSGSGSSPSHFDLEVPAIMPVVKELCGLDNVERYLEGLMSSK